MGYLGRRLALAAALVMSWVLAGALSAAPAAATVTCSFDDATDKFMITQTQESDSGQIVRAGSNLVVSNAGAGVACSGPQATVTGTDVVIVNDVSGVDTRFRISQVGGVFGPGEEDEQPAINTSDEIEFQVDMGTGLNDVLEIFGSAGAPLWRLGQTGFGNGLNLNAASESSLFPGMDADVDFAGVNRLELEPFNPNNVRIQAGGGPPEFTNPLSTNTEITLAQGNDTVFGGDGADIVLPSLGNDAVSGGGGNDNFFQGDDSGDDDLDGGVGADAVRYGSGGHHRVDLRLTSRQDTGPGGRDLLSSVEDVTTSSGNDVLIGNDDSNTLESGEGDDLLMGLGGTLDVLYDEVGVGTVSYATPPAGVTEGVNVDLAVVVNQDTGGAGVDRFESGFENVIASPFADTLRGTAEANRFDVRDGRNDNVTCRGGDDTVVADVAGTDTLAADCENRVFDVRPDTEIVSGPPGLSQDRTPSFSFRATKAGSSLECSLDGAAFGSCSSPRTLPAVQDGAHGFRVRARDLFGALDLTPATQAFSVDDTDPAITGASIAKRFRLARGRTAVGSRTRRGSAFRYRLSEDATVKIRIQRCTRLSANGRRCRRYRTLKTLTRDGQQGRNRHRFTGRIRGVPARRGLFRATLRATDEAGNRSRAKRLGFRIVRR